MPRSSDQPARRRTSRRPSPRCRPSSCPRASPASCRTTRTSCCSHVAWVRTAARVRSCSGARARVPISSCSEVDSSRSSRSTSRAGSHARACSSTCSTARRMPAISARAWPRATPRRSPHTARSRRSRSCAERASESWQRCGRSSRTRTSWSWKRGRRRRCASSATACVTSTAWWQPRRMPPSA